MAATFGGQCKAWLQMPDGSVLEMDVLSASVDYGVEEVRSFGSDNVDFVAGPRGVRMELVSIGPAVLRSHEGFTRSLRERRRSEEWQCDYCRRPNARERETCSGCGAVRSFIYD